MRIIFILLAFFILQLNPFTIFSEGCSKETKVGAPNMEGKYKLTWSGNQIDGIVAKCSVISKTEAQKLKSDYTCKERPASESNIQKPHYSCSPKKSGKRITIFNTSSDCDKEREIQQANADSA